MLQRREFLGSIPLSALAINSVATAADEPAKTPAEKVDAAGSQAIIISPPVVQHLTPRGFTVVWQVGQLATGWLEWGWSADKLDQVARASHHGLIDAAEDVLAVRIALPEAAPGKTIHYRVHSQALKYKSAYSLERGKEFDQSAIHAVKLPEPAATDCSLVVINDTHENSETILALGKRIAALDPPLLVWNGDTCNDFDAKDSPAAILLHPASSEKRQGVAWASTRGLLFVPGNHDVRGARAREMQRSMRPWNDGPLPYNVAFRHGPLAIVTLDTGEDKPDIHPVFAGTAAYEPYRAAQTAWLKEVVQREEIHTAPFRILLCHIPLRGILGDPDGTTVKAAAHHCGDGARQWLPILNEAKFNAIISGHMHAWRVDDPTPEQPVTQIVGGGPAHGYATVIRVDCTTKELKIVMEDLHEKVLTERSWKA